MRMQIRYSGDQNVSKTDLGAKIENDTLILPELLKPLLEESGARDAIAFYALVYSFPSSFADHLNWSAQEVQATLPNVRNILRGHVPDAILDFDAATNPRRHLGGVLPPKGVPFPPGAKVPPAPKK